MLFDFIEREREIVRQREYDGSGDGSYIENTCYGYELSDLFTPTS